MMSEQEGRGERATGCNVYIELLGRGWSTPNGRHI